MGVDEEESGQWDEEQVLAASCTCRDGALPYDVGERYFWKEERRCSQNSAPAFSEQEEQEG
jgi:hypothetical protein